MKINPAPAKRPFFSIYAIPIALFLAGASGLAAALIGDGVWDVAGWLGLATIVGCSTWFSLRRTD